MIENQNSLYSVNLQKGIVLNVDSLLGKKGESLPVSRFIEDFGIIKKTRPQEAQQVVTSFVAAGVVHPDQFLTFFQLVSVVPQFQEQTFSSSFYTFMGDINSTVKTLPCEATNELTQKPDKIGTFLDIYSFKSAEPAVNPIHSTLTTLDRKVVTAVQNCSEEILKKTFQNCTTQREIIDVMYNSAVYLLNNDSPQNRAFLCDLLSFSSPFLGVSNAQAGRYVAAQISTDEEVFMKYYWLNTTAHALITLIRNNYHRDKFEDKINRIMRTNSGFAEMYRDKKRIIDLPKVDAFIEEEKALEETDWHGLLPNLNEKDDFADLLNPPTFPYSVVTRPNPLMMLVKRLTTEIYADTIEGIVPIVLPTTNTTYNVIIEKGKPEDMLEKPKRAMRFVYIQGPGGEVIHPDAVCDALRWFRPELSGVTFTGLERATLRKIKRRINSPKRSIPAGGIVIEFDDKTHPFMDAKSIGIDRRGRNFYITFGNYMISLQLNEQYRLTAHDGSELPLDENTRIWWETAVLSIFADATSPIEGDEILLSDGKVSTPDEVKERTEHAFTYRSPHMRRLPPGRGYDRKRAIELLSVEWPFPHIRTPIDLAQYNAQYEDPITHKRGLTPKDGEWTYVHKAEPNEEKALQEVKREKKPLKLHATRSALFELNAALENQNKT